MEFYFQQLINALQLGSFYALIAIGYSMVYGVLLLFNFAHGDVFMVGAYIGFFVSTGLLALDVGGLIGLPPGVALGLVLVLTLIISMFLNSLVGMLVERIGYRPLRGAPRASAAITGLMIGIILETGNLAILGPQRLSFPQLITSATIKIAGVSVTNKKILIVFVSILLTLALHQFVRRTKWGMAMRAMAYRLRRRPADGHLDQSHCPDDLRPRFRACCCCGDLIRHRLSSAGSQHGYSLWMEGFRSGDPRWSRIDRRRRPGGVPAWIY